MPDLYTFTGNQVTGYMAYRDVVTGAMLVAEPGRVYQITGIALEDPVPPPDGRWTLAGGGVTITLRSPDEPSGDVTIEGPTAFAGTSAPAPDDPPASE